MYSKIIDVDIDIDCIPSTSGKRITEATADEVVPGLLANAMELHAPKVILLLRLYRDITIFPL